LNIDGALDSLNDTRELSEQAVTHQLYDTSLALGDFGLDQLFAERL
jgi:hypothetical protein